MRKTSRRKLKERNELSDMREALGWSVKQMAKRLELVPSTVNKWETCEEIPLVNRLIYEHLQLLQELHPEPPPVVKTPINNLLRKYGPGNRVGRLRVLKVVERNTYGHLQVRVECDCGHSLIVRAANLATRYQCKAACPLARTPIPASESVNLYYRISELPPELMEESEMNRRIATRYREVIEKQRKADDAWMYDDL